MPDNPRWLPAYLVRRYEPIHTVNLGAYWIDQTEVTNAKYAQCVDNGVCNLPDSTSYTSDGYYNNPEFNDYPVLYVSWGDADAYCEWAGRRYRAKPNGRKQQAGMKDAQAQRLYPWGNIFDERKRLISVIPIAHWL